MPAGGGALTAARAAQSADGSRLLLPCGNLVRIYGAVVGEELFRLEGHTADVTSVAVHPRTPSQVLTASLDKTIRIWNLDTGELINTYEVGERISSLVVPASGRLAFLSVLRKGGAGRVMAFNLGQGKLLGHVHKTAAPCALHASLSGAYVAAFEKHTLSVFCVARPECKPLVLHHTKPFTAVAISPADDQIAAGDATGRILLYHGLQAAFTAAEPSGTPHESALSATTLHWHAHHVGALAFSRDGTALMSGGLEAVLVAWSLDTGRRTYLPRLGGGIVQILPNPVDHAKYVVCQADNTIRSINAATLAVEASIHGIRPPPPLPAPNLSALIPGSGTLVTNTQHALLQFYDVARDAHVAKLAVVPRNAVALPVTSAEAAAHEPAGPRAMEPAATALAFGAGGRTMVTADTRPETATGGSTATSLKFWEKPGGAVDPHAPYALNTQADDPHGPHELSQLVHHPSEALAVSTSTGACEFRIWGRGGGDAGAGGFWSCRAVGGYKGAPCGAAAFTADGSVLAVAAGRAVTLWDPLHVALAGVLRPPDGVTAVRTLRHVPGTPFLVAVAAGAEPALLVWNLLTKGLWWAHRFDCADAIAVSQRRFAVAVRPEHSARDHGPAAVVLEFDPARPAPEAGWAVARSGVSSLHYADEGTWRAAEGREGAPLLVLMEDRTFSVVGEHEDAAGTAMDRRSANAELAAAAASSAPRRADVAPVRAADVAPARADAEPKAAGVKDGEPAWRSLFDGPSHALSPLSSLSTAFLEAITCKSLEAH